MQCAMCACVRVRVYVYELPNQKRIKSSTSSSKSPKKGEVGWEKDSAYKYCIGKCVSKNYVCRYVCTYLRTYVRTYVRMHACMYVCIITSDGLFVWGHPGYIGTIWENIGTIWENIGTIWENIGTINKYVGTKRKKCRNLKILGCAERIAVRFSLLSWHKHLQRCGHSYPKPQDQWLCWNQNHRIINSRFMF